MSVPYSIYEIYKHRGWEIIVRCNECYSFSSVWYLSQNPFNIADAYIMGSSPIRYFAISRIKMKGC